MYKKAILAAGLSLLASLGAQAATTTPFKASYDLIQPDADFKLGKARISLEKDDQDDCYTYTARAQPNRMARMLLGDMLSIHSESRFCVVDGHIRPQHFSQEISGLPRESYTLDFDWSKMRVQYQNDKGDKHSYDLESGAQDPMSLQIAVRQWLTDQDDHDKLAREYHFKLAGDDGISNHEVDVDKADDIKTDAGEFATVSMAYQESKRFNLKLWLARDADWVPVRVQQNISDISFNLMLKSLSRD